MAEKILEVQELTTMFRTERGIMKAVDGVSFHVNKGEILGIVGESGCGKSVTSQSILRLFDEKYTAQYQGKILFKGRDILKIPMKEMQDIRGHEISMVFQDALSSLNPVFTVGEQIMETILIHQNVRKEEAKKRSIEMLRLVGIPAPEQRFSQYPHELSGGMRQRVMIAIALSCCPNLLIADEPTTALDVTIQAQIMDLLVELKDKINTAIILITHDLGVVAGIADRVAVMYAGKVVETGTTAQIFYEHKHPYTEALLRSLPSAEAGKREPLMSIPGTPPDLLCPPKGCGFAARCRHCMQICREEQPPEFELGDGHKASCWLLHPDCPCAAERGDDQ